MGSSINTFAALGPAPSCMPVISAWWVPSCFCKPKGVARIYFGWLWKPSLSFTLCLAILGNTIHVCSRRSYVFSHTFTSAETEKRKMVLESFTEMLKMQMAWEVINSLLTLGHESRQRVGQKKEQLQTAQAQTFCLPGYMHLFSMPGCNTTTAGKFIALLAMHSSLILHTSLQEKLVLVGLFFFLVHWRGNRWRRLLVRCSVHWFKDWKFAHSKCLPSALHNVAHSLCYDY